MENVTFACSSSPWFAYASSDGLPVYTVIYMASRQLKHCAALRSSQGVAHQCAHPASIGRLLRPESKRGRGLQAADNNKHLHHLRLDGALHWRLLHPLVFGLRHLPHVRLGLERYGGLGSGLQRQRGSRGLGWQSPQLGAKIKLSIRSHQR